MQGGGQGTIGNLGLLGRHTELRVETGQEVPQHGVGLVDGRGSRQPEFADQPVLEGAVHAFHASLGLWRTGKDLFDAQFPHGPGELGWAHRLGDMPGLAVELEDPVAITVESQGDAVASDYPIHQQEVAPSVLLGSEYGIGHRAGGVVHCQQQYESGPSVLQPAMMAAVDLHQHALLGHTLPAYTMLGGTMAPGTDQAVAVEQTAYRLPAQLNALPLCQDLGQVAVVEADVFLAGQDDRGGSDIIGDRVAGLAAPVAVDQCGSPIPLVGRQDSPDLAFADPQNFGPPEPWEVDIPSRC